MTFGFINRVAQVNSLTSERGSQLKLCTLFDTSHTSTHNARFHSYEIDSVASRFYMNEIINMFTRQFSSFSLQYIHSAIQLKPHYVYRDRISVPGCHSTLTILYYAFGLVIFVFDFSYFSKQTE